MWAGEEEEEAGAPGERRLTTDAFWGREGLAFRMCAWGGLSAGAGGGC